MIFAAGMIRETIGGDFPEERARVKWRTSGAGSIQALTVTTDLAG